MAREEERRYFFTRHSLKVGKDGNESNQYKGLSDKGVELARRSTKNIVKEIEDSDPNSVIYLGGATDQVRTVSTMRVYGEELKRIYADKSDKYAVLTTEDLHGAKDYNEVFGTIKNFIDQNNGKRVIIVTPMPIPSLSPIKRGWFTKEGKPTAYSAKLLEKYPDEYEALKHWIETRGVEGKLRGPAPEEVARGYEKAAHQLEGTIRQLVGDRPVVTGFVGHSYEIDTFLAYIAGNGRIDLDSLEMIASGDKMVKETELASVRISPTVTTLNYRGQKKIEHSLEDIVGMIAVGSLLISVLAFSNMTGNVIGAGAVSKTGLIFIALGLLTSIGWFGLKARKIKKGIKLNVYKAQK